MPTFCRHNRFVERCPICAETLPGSTGTRSHAGRQGSQRSTAASARRERSERGPHGQGAGRGRAQIKVYDDGAKRAQDDGYSCSLVPGIRSSGDAGRLGQEIGFANGRLLALATDPPGLYGEARLLGVQGELELATWICFLAAYLSPLEDEDPFAGIREALALAPTPEAAEDPELRLEEIALGPRTSHQPANGRDTLIAYRRWSEQAGSQVAAFSGDEGWSPERRFERIFERLALPGLARSGRYEVLVTLGRLGIYDLRADSLHLGAQSQRPAGGGAPMSDATILAAKRVFGIGDPLLLERRAHELALACSVPIDTLDQALANWGASERASMGVTAECLDHQARERADLALELNRQPAQSFDSPLP